MNPQTKLPLDDDADDGRETVRAFCSRCGAEVGHTRTLLGLECVRCSKLRPWEFSDEAPGGGSE
jgi:hypothetical protein